MLNISLLFTSQSHKGTINIVIFIFDGTRLAQSYSESDSDWSFFWWISDVNTMSTQCQQSSCLEMPQNYLDSGKNDVAQISLSDLPPRRKNLENTSTFTWFCTTFCNEAIFSHCHLNSRLLFQHIPRNNLGHKIFVDAHNLRETKWTVTCQFLKINLF